MIKETPGAQRLTANEFTASDGAHQVPMEGRGARAPEGFPKPHEVQKLLEPLRISQPKDGDLRVEAPKETALTLAPIQGQRKLMISRARKTRECAGVPRPMPHVTPMTGARGSQVLHA